jgi:hypothetical protein
MAPPDSACTAPRHERLHVGEEPAREHRGVKHERQHLGRIHRPHDFPPRAVAAAQVDECEGSKLLIQGITLCSDARARRLQLLRCCSTAAAPTLVHTTAKGLGLQAALSSYMDG